MLYLKPAAELGSTIHVVLLCRFAEHKLKVMEAVPSFQKTTKARQCVTLRSFVKMERWNPHFIRDLWMLEMQRPWEICKKLKKKLQSQSRSGPRDRSYLRYM